MTNKRLVHQLSASLLSLFVVCLWPVAAAGQCVGGTTTLTHSTHTWRVDFNDVEMQASTFVTGDFWYNWDNLLTSTGRLGSSTIHSQTTVDPAVGVDAVLEWHSAPSSVGTGTYNLSTYHEWSCGGATYDSSTYSFRSISSPTIGQLPYQNRLWYFGPGTPGAVPVGGGYAYQFSNLVFNKNCSAGGGESCGGSASWSETDPSGLVSVSSGGVLESTSGGTCSYDSYVNASLDGWEISEPILVNSPEFLWHPQSESTSAYGTGFKTDEFWSVADACGPPANAVPSVALHEEFGTFQKPASNWDSPAATSASGYNVDTYTFKDSIAANDPGGYSPVPTFTSSSPPYTYNTLLMYGSQKWFIGDQSAGDGRQVFSGTIKYYRDHGDSQ